MTDALTGLFFIKDAGDVYSTGRIVARAEEGFYLLQFDDMSGKESVMPMQVMGINEMALNNHDTTMSLFPTREALNEYIEWVDTPSKPVVMALVPKEPK